MPGKGQDKDGVIFDNAWLYNGGTDASPNYTVRKDPPTTIAKALRNLEAEAATPLAVDGQQQ